MSDWIEFNGVWQKWSGCAKIPYPPNLEHKMPEKFKCVLEVDEKTDDLNVRFFGWEDEDLERANTEESKIVLAYRRLDRELAHWENEQPEMIEWKRACYEAEAQYEMTDGFVNQGLNKPGTLIETGEGRVLLIGDVNTWGGGDDGSQCMGCGPTMDDDTVIIRYKVLDY